MFAMEDPAATVSSSEDGAPNDDRCRLLELAAELCNDIWQYCLTIVPESSGRVKLSKQKDTDQCLSVDIPVPWRSLMVVGSDGRLPPLRPPSGPRSLAARPRRTILPSRLSLLLTCRQINKDAAGIFYDRNAIQIDAVAFQPLSAKLPSMQDVGFLEVTSKARLDALGSLTIRQSFTSYMNFAMKKLAREEIRSPRLRELIIVAHACDYDSETVKTIKRALVKLRALEEFEIECGASTAWRKKLPELQALLA